MHRLLAKAADFASSRLVPGSAIDLDDLVNSILPALEFIF
jgi:hypothetical protein